MPDVFTKAKRSQVMSRIRSRGNKNKELALARVFRAQGITGWRRQIQIRIAERGMRNGTSPRPSPQSGAGEARRRRKNSQRSTFNSQLTVRPDFVFPKQRLAVFVNGCFWHGCPLHETKPKNNAAFWRRKLAGNKARDQAVTRTLRRSGWRVLRLWEHELARRNAARLLRRIKSVVALLRLP